MMYTLKQNNPNRQSGFSLLACLFRGALMLGVMLGLPLAGGAAQPVNTYNVVVDGGAIGDGISDDTAAINAAVVNAKNAGQQGVYFPVGHYMISGQINSLDGVSFYGEPSGLSVIAAAPGSFQALGDQVFDNYVHNINIEDLHFLNVQVSYSGGGNRKNYHAVRRCIFLSNDLAASQQVQLNWGYVRDGVVEHCIFLRQHNSQGVGIGNYKTNGCEVRDNVWGLDLERLGWLATEWSGYPAWDDLEGKLATLQSSYGLDWDQGRFRCAYYPNRVINEKIQDNIFNGSPYYYSGDVNSDHVVYSKDYTNLQVIGNWFRGWKMDASGGLKLRNAYGPATIAANHFVNTPLLQYTYSATDVPEVYSNVMVYKNYFTIRPDANETFDRRGISYWENAAIGGDSNIQYHFNTFNCETTAPNVAISISNQGNPAEHTVYDSNLFEASDVKVPYLGYASEPQSYTAGAPADDLSAYLLHPVPMLDIPEYGSAIALKEDFSGETLASLMAQGWSFSGQAGVEDIFSTSASDLMGAGKQFLRIGGTAASQPYAQVAFGEVAQGQLSLKAFTSSSYSNARIKLLDAAGNVLFAFRLTSPVTLAVENTVTGFSANPMPNGATHNLISAGNSITELMLKWDGSGCFWQARNRNADSGEVIYNSGFVKDTFGQAGAPAQLRLDTGTYNHTARFFGVTDLQLDALGVGAVPPVFNGAQINTANATEDTAYVGTLAGQASDANSDPLSFSKVSGPAWLNVAVDGTLSGTPANGDVGLNVFSVQVDTIDGSDTAVLNITVINTNDAPTFTVDPINVTGATEGIAYSATISGMATDVDLGDALTYSKFDGPAWLNVAADGSLSGTPGAGDLNANVFTVEVSDANGGSAQATLNIMVAPMTVHVDSITLSVVAAGGPNRYGRATVVILDKVGQPVQNATVTGTFSDGLSEQLTGTTDAAGQVVLTTSVKARPAFSLTFTVDTVTHASYPYDAAENVVTTVSASF